MQYLFFINPSIVIGLVSALGCAYFLCICAEETKTLLAYRRSMRQPAEKLANHKRVKFPRFPRDMRHTSAPAPYFVPADARFAPSRL